MCALGFQLSQNGGPSTGVDDFLAIVSALVAAIPDFRIENAVRSDTLAGFVEEPEHVASYAVSAPHDEDKVALEATVALFPSDPSIRST